ncbi:mitotic check point protein bub2 [Anaeramoeba ignava]|uniref:Mitotic check point protein bub2 n=1 Tax=Anaeramoeba ignava TaxID=1746090 RepID=A0A9Q0RFM6_ANAIG|nr:mitotic check point protein bub2 [Anaeramoeba ignava]
MIFSTETEFKQFLNEKIEKPEDLQKKLKQLKKQILLKGLPTQSQEKTAGCTIRGTVWKILLKIQTISTEKYLNYIQNGGISEKQSQKINNDVVRASRKLKEINSQISENCLKRVLGVFSYKIEKHNKKPAVISQPHKVSPYVQGMPLICGFFLCNMPEVDAFCSFQKLILNHCPLYFEQQNIGPTQGTKLSRLILQKVDPELFATFLKFEKEKFFSPFEKILFFNPILSFCTEIPPANQVIMIWDFLLAFGVHLNVVIVIAYVILLRQEFLSGKLLSNFTSRKFPEIDAKATISLAVSIIREIPEQLNKDLINHTHKFLPNLSTEQI